MLNGFGTIVNALGKRVKPYLPQICGTILWRLNNKSAKVRQQAADLISRIAVVMKTCQEVGVTFALCRFSLCVLVFLTIPYSWYGCIAWGHNVPCMMCNN